MWWSDNCESLVSFRGARTRMRSALTEGVPKFIFANCGFIGKNANSRFSRSAADTPHRQTFNAEKRQYCQSFADLRRYPAETNLLGEILKRSFVHALFNRRRHLLRISEHPLTGLEMFAALVTWAFARPTRCSPGFHMTGFQPWFCGFGHHLRHRPRAHSRIMPATAPLVSMKTSETSAVRVGTNIW